MEECRKIGRCPTGSAVATGAGKLKAQYIFHAVGPIYHRQPEDARLLASAYQACLDLAEKYQVKSMAFPALSTGVYGYPASEATPIALSTVIEHLKKPTSLQQITFVLFDDRLFMAYESNLQKLLPA
jgi:O-acetyl-ADP-ribose deacetylase